MSFLRKKTIVQESNLLKLISLFLVPFLSLVQLSASEIDKDLLNQFIAAKGGNTIVFKASNIKQFWIEPSVLAKEDSIQISLGTTLNYSHTFQSTPLKIQLANVVPTQDCTIEVITETPDLTYSVLNTKNKIISKSEQTDTFIQDSIISSKFHLYDTNDFAFYLNFYSDKSEIIKIKAIVLSFSNNQSFFSFPTNNINPDNARIIANSITPQNDGSYSLVGKKIIVVSNEKIDVRDKPFYQSVRLSNKGTGASTVYLGYSLYNKEGINLDDRNYPYKNNDVMTVISAKKGDSKIIVKDNNSKWIKGCSLAVNAKEDKSDLPNTTFVDGKLVECKTLDDGTSEITLDTPLASDLSKGTKLRIHGITGSNLYGIITSLRSGEESVLTTIVKKDQNQFCINPTLFPVGVDYVTPLLIVIPSDSKVDGTIKVKDFAVAY